ncbi:C-C motif chemokine 20-like [Archocentrus centrarchus]|uniref:C-C motif chemokine 20-like n=1 Tax=Archocentrus centrarchus TaxID=63155 RepID=UPI0011E9D9FE|nr:C-C motif chemokine 20-like [Archocentrus centrarchus]
MVDSGRLLVLVCTVWVVVAMSGPEARRYASKRRPCCVHVTTIDKSAEVVGDTYHEQDAAHLCVKAVIFNTNVRKLCADPNAQWVQNLTASMMKV